MYSATVVDRLINDLRSATSDLDKLNKESAEFYLCLSNIGALCSNNIVRKSDLDQALEYLEHDADISRVCENAYTGVAELLHRELYWRTETLRLREILIQVFGLDPEQVHTEHEQIDFIRR